MPDRRCAIAAVVLLLALSSCQAPAGDAPARPGPHGGTLRVIDPQTAFPPAPRPDSTTLDPVSGYSDAFELFRCCLGRTLLSYTGAPTAAGGTELHPDLAAALPDVSADGLTWTFRVRTGVHYAPPYQSTEVVAGDFVRALQRSARLSMPAPPYYSIIRGYAEYAAGRTASISGLEAPDPHTLVVRLVRPAGDLGYRLSSGATAPIPPLRRDPGAPFGAYSGRDSGIWGFVVSSGPYMIDGAGSVDVEAPVSEQRDPRGFVRGVSVTLVRNPSWTAASDALRPALADRIVIDFRPDVAQAAAAVDSGRADVVVTLLNPPQAPVSQIRAYQADPRLGHVDIELGDGIRYVSMNLAVAPFDDVHVRRAVAFVIDRAAMREAHGGAIAGASTGHIVPDSLENAALLTYDPFRAPDAATRIQLAREEMAQSRYDSTRSGQCDSPECQHVAAMTIVGTNHPAAFGTIVRDDLAKIGINVDNMENDGPTFFHALADPSTKTALAIGWGWFTDYPSGSDYFTGIFSHDAIGTSGNYSLLGATPEQLRGWGFGVAAVPGIDDRIDQCLPRVGADQARCWAVLDAYITEKVVSLVPIVTEGYIEVVPARVTAYSYDQAFDLPALDRIAVG